MFFSEWMDILLYKKKPEEVVKSNPSLGAGLLQLAVALFLVGVVSALAFLLNPAFGSLNVIGAVFALVGGPVVGLIGFLVGAFLLHFLSKALGGKGSFSQLTGSMALVYAAVMGTAQLALGVVGLVLGLVGLGLLNAILGLVGFLVSLWLLFLFLKTLAAVQGFSLLRALAVFVVLVVAMAVLAFIIGLLVGAAFLAAMTGGMMGSGALQSMSGLYG